MNDSSSRFDDCGVTNWPSDKVTDRLRATVPPLLFYSCSPAAREQNVSSTS